MIRLEDEDFIRIGMDVPDEPRAFGIERHGEDGPLTAIGRRGSRPQHGIRGLERELPFFEDDFPGRGRGIGIAKAAVTRNRIGPPGNPNRGVEVWAYRPGGKPPWAEKPDEPGPPDGQEGGNGNGGGQGSGGGKP